MAVREIDEESAVNKLWLWEQVAETIIMGDIEGFLEVFRRVMSDSSGNLEVPVFLFQNMLKALLASSMIDSIVVCSSTSPLDTEETQITGMFWTMLLRNIIKGVEQNIEISAEEFQQLVIISADSVCEAMKLHSTPINVTVILKVPEVVNL